MKSKKVLAGTCKKCGAEIFDKPWKVGKRKSCSNKCSLLLAKDARTGDKPHGTIDGMTIYHNSYDGYLFVEPEGKRVRLHRYVAEKEFGREAIAGKHIHHKDGDRLNNSPENLMILTNAEHRREHAWVRIRKAGGDPDKDKICRICKRLVSRSRFDKLWRSYDGLSQICKDCQRIENKNRRNRYAKKRN